MKNHLSLLLAFLFILSFPAFAEEGAQFDSFYDAREYIIAQAENYAQSFSFSADDLQSYDISTVADWTRAISGQYTASVTRDGNTLTVTLCYYPGVKIYKALVTQDTRDLTDDELRAANIAHEVASDALAHSDSDYELVRYLHDWLCENVNYEAMPEERPTLPDVCTATYALVYGKANCQGYTDAFRLLARLAGLNVRKQEGDGHDWNVVEIDGQWYIVDVTYDDIEDSDAWSYAYMLVGTDVCDHAWDSRIDVADVSANTRMNLWYYTRNNVIYDNCDDLASAAYFARRDNGQTIFYGLVREPDLTWNDLSDAILSLANDRGKKCSWTVWSSRRAAYTYFYVEWTEW